MRIVGSAIDTKRLYLALEFKKLKVDLNPRMRTDKMPGVEILVAVCVFDVGIFGKRIMHGQRQQCNGNHLTLAEQSSTPF
ncbi:MAG: hypothetical protein K6G91_13720 [Kiritimatiellae bacterium]|nr:hypothetical protein [Kiritimatiellia bacterium]